MSLRGGAYRAVNKKLEGLTGEAPLRTQANRLYYAAYTDVTYHCVTQLTFRPTGGTEDHKRLLEYLRKEAHQSGLANLMGELHAIRKNADYSTDRVFLAKELGEAKGKVIRIYELLQKMGGRSFTDS